MRKPFTQIPVHLIRDAQIDIYAFRIYCIIKSYNPCWAGTRRLSEESGLARSTVINAIKKLKSLGLIKSKKHGRGVKYTVYEEIKNRDPTGLSDGPVDETTGLPHGPHWSAGRSSTGLPDGPQLDSMTYIKLNKSKNEVCNEGDNNDRFQRQFNKLFGNKKHGK